MLTFNNIDTVDPEALTLTDNVTLIMQDLL